MADKLATLTILATEAESDLLSAHLSEGQVRVLVSSIEQLLVGTPAALTGTLMLEYAQEYPGVNFKPVKDYLDNDIVFDADSQIGVPYVTFKDLRFASSSAEASNRSIDLLAKLRMPSS